MRTGWLLVGPLLGAFASTARAQDEAGNRAARTSPRVLSLGSAPGLSLTLVGTIDVSGFLWNTSVGGLAFDDSSERLWLSDSTSRTNSIFEIEPSSGTLISSFDASVIDDLSLGPDAIALHPVTGNIFAFSSFLESEAGEATQAGVLMNLLPSAHDAGGAAFDNAGRLFVVDEEGGTLLRLDPTTGNIVEAISITGYSGRLSALDFHSPSGRLFAYANEIQLLIEIDPSTGACLSSTDVAAFAHDTDFPAGMAFNSDGSRLYFIGGTKAPEIQVLDTTQIFSDGFESEDLSAWSAVVP